VKMSEVTEAEYSQESEQTMGLSLLQSTINLANKPNYFDIASYLHRINYSGNVEKNKQTLINLHQAHLFNIPFENLDIHLGEEIDLHPQALYKKIVQQRRGGYCFELNELFTQLLLNLDFEVERLSARVFVKERITPRHHQLLKVKFDGQAWLCDVGFGCRGFIQPIPLIYNKPFSQTSGIYRLLQHDSFGSILQRKLEKDSKWDNLYAFTPEVYLPLDFTSQNYVVSHSPGSIFVNLRFCTIAKPNGRISLSAYNLKVLENGHEKIFKIKNQSEYLQVLNNHFGIKLPADINFIPAKYNEEPQPRFDIGPV
ncbi:MAG: arylamine N-acetyltransferase, partial [Pseudomonadota bacterium]